MNPEQSKTKFELKKAYKEFLGEEGGADMINKSYEFQKQEVVVRIFEFQEETAGAAAKLYLDANSDRTVADTRPPRVFAVAKVLAVGNMVERDIKPGDIVGLNDWTFTTIINPEWIGWTTNGMRNSNAKQLGKEPNKYINNTGKMVSKLFIPQKISITREDTDFRTYCLLEPEIGPKIKDPHAIVED